MFALRGPNAPNPGAATDGKTVASERSDARNTSERELKRADLSAAAGAGRAAVPREAPAEPKEIKPAFNFMDTDGEAPKLDKEEARSRDRQRLKAWEEQNQVELNSDGGGQGGPAYGGDREDEDRMVEPKRQPPVRSRSRPRPPASSWSVRPNLDGPLSVRASVAGSAASSTDRGLMCSGLRAA